MGDLGHPTTSNSSSDKDVDYSSRRALQCRPQVLRKDPLPRSLKNAQDWYVRRDLWRTKAIELRVHFEKHRDVRDPRRVAAMLAEVEREQKRWAHPDPTVMPMSPNC